MDVFGASDFYARLLKATQDGELVDLGEVITCLAIFAQPVIDHAQSNSASKSSLLRQRRLWL